MSRGRVQIIAEAGVNHNGDMNLAKALVDQAADMGVDAVKFQTFSTKRLTVDNAPKAAYQKQTTSTQESQTAMLAKLELDMDAHHLLFDHCRKRGVEFISSPFDVDSVAILQELGVQTIKIPSGEITHVPLLRAVAQTHTQVLISTGMAEAKSSMRSASPLSSRLSSSPSTRVIRAGSM